MDKVIAVAAVIFAAAVLGSVAAWLMGHPHRPDIGDTSRRGARRYGLATYLMVGIVAAGAVPLLLSLVRSELVTGIFLAEWADIYENLVILFGLGLVAAYAGRFAVESSDRRMLDDLDTMRDQLREAQAKARALAEYVDDRSADERKLAKGAAAKKEAEKHQQVARSFSEAQALYVASLGKTDHAVLRAMTARDYRTAAGVAADLELPRFKVSDMLDDMAEAGLLKAEESPVTHGRRFAITQVGWAALHVEHRAEPVAKVA
ncbi:YEATS-associated helix-containing protein [Sphingomicrobium sp. XHP0239]|uniref:YEATS-associated helix-containing protein n=1 Tax=Sphingomicrobium maritimum TaxID=3133972 RepID=UPI0031CCCFA1